MTRVSFRQQILRVREDAIINAVNRLLAEKGFDLMTVDEVAADVGIAKASLYKHFASKEALAAAAMVRVLGRTQAVIDQLAARTELSALGRLKGLVRWALQLQLAGEMPTLPSQNSTLRAELLANKGYIDGLMQVSDDIGSWIVQAQADGRIAADLPPELVLYQLFARACDPVLAVMRAGGAHSDSQIVDWLVRTCFKGLAA